MANDFVRNVKGVRNINNLSRNITTENDLISTNDNEVYVVTNAGYKKITGGETEQDIELLETDVEKLKTSTDNNTSEIKNLKKSTGNNTSEIETFKTSLEENTSEIKNLKTSTDNNTSKIRTLEISTGNNTSEIKNLKKSTDNNTSEIETLETKTDNNTSEIATLKKSTDNNTSEIETLKTSTGNNTSEIDTLKTSTETNTSDIDSTQTLIEELQKQLDELKSKTLSFYTLFEGSAKGVGTTIKLNDDYTKYKLLFISGRYGGGDFTQEYSTSLSDSIVIQKTNVSDADGDGGGHHELIIEKINNTELKITNDVFYDYGSNTGSGADANRFTITNIEGVK